MSTSSVPCESREPPLSTSSVPTVVHNMFFIPASHRKPDHFAVAVRLPDRRFSESSKSLPPAFRRTKAHFGNPRARTDCRAAGEFLCGPDIMWEDGVSWERGGGSLCFNIAPRPPPRPNSMTRPAHFTSSAFPHLTCLSGPHNFGIVQYTDAVPQTLLRVQPRLAEPATGSPRERLI